MKKSTPSDLEIQHEIGRRLKKTRLNLDISQAELARDTGVSRRTITNAENGRGCTLSNLIAILRHLGKLDALDAFIPDPGISPIQLSKLKGQERMRASGERTKTITVNEEQWTWGK